MKERLYNLPKYYDIAFSRNTVSEIKLFHKLFKRHVPFQVKSLLEPAYGICILHLSCAWDHLHPEEKTEWTSKEEDIQIKTTWRVESQDHLKKISHELCTMEINDHGRHLCVENHHELRLCFYEDLKDLIIKSKKCKLEAIYSETLNQIPVNSHIRGELGNLCYVLKAS